MDALAKQTLSSLAEMTADDPTRTSLRTFDTETGVAEAGLVLDGLAKTFRRLETATRGDNVKSEP